MWVEKPDVRVSDDDDKGTQSPQQERSPIKADSLQRDDWMSGGDDFSSFGRKRGLEEVEKETEKDREEKRRKVVISFVTYYLASGDGSP